MYICTDCKKRFFDAKIEFETHGLESPPFERTMSCPYCGSFDIAFIEPHYCRSCGMRLREENKSGYCSALCKKRGDKMRERERKARENRFKNPLEKVILKLKKYNKENGTNLSYGEFVALVLPKK